MGKYEEIYLALTDDFEWGLGTIRHWNNRPSSFT
jgi:hypothetical protein